MIKHAVAGRFAAVAAMMVSLSASAITQTLSDGDSLADAVTAAKADYDANLTPQEIVLGKGTYELTATQRIQFPLVVRGATGNPADVTIDGKKKTQLFQLDHANAAILSVTLTGGSVWPEDGRADYFGGAVRIERLHGTGSGQEGWRQFYNGAGGTVSNCVITGCEAKMVSGNTGAHAAAIACLSPNGLVTHCRIVGNASERWNNTSASEAGTIVSMARGTMRNCLVAGNEQKKEFKGCVVSVGNGATVINCDILLNSSVGTSAPTVDALSGSTIVNTVIAGNTTTSTAEHYAIWRGTASAFVKCVTDGDLKINETCQLSTLEDLKLLDAEGYDIRPLSGSALLGEGTVDAAYDYGTTDLYGKPRFRDGKIDVGAAQFDANAYVLECSATPDTKLYAPRTAVLTAKALGFGDAPAFYWDFDGDGKADLVTTEPSVTQSFGAGVHSISVCVSNDVATFGAKYVFAEPFEVLAQPVRYVKAGNVGKEPYDSEANAAGDIQTAINFCGEEEKIIVLKGVYNTTEAVNVNKKLEVVGATGNPEDVVIHNTVTGYRCLKVTKADAFVASMVLENGSPDWSHDSVTSYKGTGAYVTAGTVSNLVVRDCKVSIDSVSIGAGITAIGRNTFVTHCVISNNTASGGTPWGFYVSGVGLDLRDGARAENCLIANNRTKQESNAWYGWGHCAVFVGEGSSMRFCTVVGNRCTLCGGVGVYGTGVFRECLVAGNAVFGSTLDNKARHTTWGAFSPALKFSHEAGRGEKNILDADAQQTEAEYAAGIAANQVCNAVDNEAHGLGETTVFAATDRLVRDLAKKDWRLPKGSPAIDKVPVEAAVDMATLDVYGNKRLFGGIYDIGCHERLVKGLMILLR